MMDSTRQNMTLQEAEAKIRGLNMALELMIRCFSRETLEQIMIAGNAASQSDDEEPAIAAAMIASGCVHIFLCEELLKKNKGNPNDN